MPIKRLATEASFPRIGTLRKGAPKGEKSPGKDLTYFRFDTDDAQAAADFLDAYGAQPQSINCYLPYSTPDENFPAWQEEYRAGGLVHRCDGETMSLHMTANGAYSTEPHPCPYATGEKERTRKEPGCKPIGRLSIIIPELRRFAYVTVLTGSINDIMELSANLNAVYAIRGNLQGVPFVLSRRPKMISTPTDDGGRRRFEKWLLFIEPDPQWVRLQLAGMRQRALQLPGDRLLVDGRTVTEDGEIVDEWEGDTLDMDRPALPQLYDENGEPYDPLSPDPYSHPEEPESEQSEASPQPVLTPKGKALAELNTVGRQHYGDGWPEKQRKLADSISTGTTQDIAQLTIKEIGRLTAGIRKEIAKERES